VHDVLEYANVYVHVYVYVYMYAYAYVYVCVYVFCKASPDSHFAFLHFFFLGMVLIPVFCTMS